MAKTHLKFCFYEMLIVLVDFCNLKLQLIYWFSARLVVVQGGEVLDM